MDRIHLVLPTMWLETIAAGTVQMGVYDFSLLNNYHQDTMVFAMPGAFQDNDEVNALADTQWAQDMFRRLLIRQKSVC